MSNYFRQSGKRLLKGGPANQLVKTTYRLVCGAHLNAVSPTFSEKKSKHVS
jgi:hypothetical protein